MGFLRKRRIAIEGLGRATALTPTLVAVALLSLGCGAQTQTTAGDHAGTEETSAALPSDEPQAPNAPAVSASEPVMPERYGIRFADDVLVADFLNLSVRCERFGARDAQASVLDLLRLRAIGWASPPFDYEVTHQTRGGYDYILVRERIKNRDGSDFRGAPGFVRRTYYFDDARGQFELVDSTPEDPGFSDDVLRELGDRLGFLSLHRDAVCNGRVHLAKAEREPAVGSDNIRTPAPRPFVSASGVDQWAKPRD